MSQNCSSSLSANGRLAEAFEKALDGLASDTPIIMHGSGDVDPASTNPETARFVASLTAQYVSDLVDAAIDSHKILVSGTRHPSSALEAPLPTRKRARLPPKPIAPDALLTAKKKQKSVRGSDDYWDQPLPEPKINGSKGKETKTNSLLHIDEWVGVTGVDLGEDRIRSAYLRGTEALSSSSFVFPICHDVYAYGRVRAAQAAKGSIQPILLQQPLMELIQEDINEQKKEKKSGGNSDPEDEDDGGEKDQGDIPDDDNDDAGPIWPGIDSVLPMSRFHSQSTGPMQFTW